MLIYHPAFDAYHCVYRMTMLTQKVKELEYSKLRILDFYLCFPAEIDNRTPETIAKHTDGRKSSYKQIQRPG